MPLDGAYSHIMPYEITDEGRGVYIRHYGFTTPREIMELTTWEADNIRDTHGYIIADLLPVNSETVFSWTHSLLEAVADDEAVRLPKTYLDRPFKLAFACDNKLLEDVLQAFIESGSRPNHDIQIFPTLQRARQWAEDG
ncbi:MAG: hypothetical protein RIC50_01850 [Rhodospirillales bacterium]